MGRIVLCQYVHYHFISKSYFILPGTSLYIGIEREIYRFDINGYLAYLLSKLAYLLNKLQEPDLYKLEDPLCSFQPFISALSIYASTRTALLLKKEKTSPMARFLKTGCQMRDIDIIFLLIPCEL